MLATRPKTYNPPAPTRPRRRLQIFQIWLDFFNKFLTEDKSSLRPEYALDGTHLNPAYLPLVQVRGRGQFLPVMHLYDITRCAS